ncbi:MAG: DUF6456 domain-containing protein, partial [Pseudomonadota bacterium]
RSAGLIEPDGEGWAISEAGRAHLKRAGSVSSENPFADQHRDLGPHTVMSDHGRMETLVGDLSHSPLARYARRLGDGPPALEPVHIAAGERLRADYHRSTMSARLTSDWTRSPGGKGRTAAGLAAEPPASRLAAKDQVLDALGAVGPGLDRLLVNICLRETGMERSERALGWPARAGLPALRIALDRLAVHYAMKAAGPRADPFCEPGGA